MVTKETVLRGVPATGDMKTEKTAGQKIDRTAVRKCSS